MTDGQGIKPIDTLWQGYRFRSRLEARWAVFFDALGIAWEYEPAGSRTARGAYLPDFHLPAVRKGLWVEVKPPHNPAEDRECTEALLAAVVGQTGEAGTIVRGDPLAFVMGEVDDWTSGVCYEGGAADDRHLFCLCPMCGRIGFEWRGHGDRVCARIGADCDQMGIEAQTGRGSTIVAAAEKARAARFEHGDGPRPGSPSQSPAPAASPLKLRRAMTLTSRRRP